MDFYYVGCIMDNRLHNQSRPVQGNTEAKCLRGSKDCRLQYRIPLFANKYNTLIMDTH